MSRVIKTHTWEEFILLWEIKMIFDIQCNCPVFLISKCTKGYFVLEPGLYGNTLKSPSCISLTDVVQMLNFYVSPKLWYVNPKGYSS